MLGFLIIIISLVLLISGLALVFVTAWIRHRRGHLVDPPFRKRELLLSPRELDVYRALGGGGLGPDLAVLPKVRLLDVLYIPKNVPNPKAWRSMVWARRVSFVVCRLPGLAPVAIVEIADPSPANATAEVKPGDTPDDEFLRRVLSNAGLPLVLIGRDDPLDAEILCRRVLGAVGGDRLRVLEVQR